MFGWKKLSCKRSKKLFCKGSMCSSRMDLKFLWTEPFTLLCSVPHLSSGSTELPCVSQSPVLARWWPSTKRSLHVCQLMAWFNAPLVLMPGNWPKSSLVCVQYGKVLGKGNLRILGALAQQGTTHMQPVCCIYAKSISSLWACRDHRITSSSYTRAG